MSDLIIKKNGTDYKLPMLAEHYPADRVYLDGDTMKTVQSELNLKQQTLSYQLSNSDSSAYYNVIENDIFSVLGAKRLIGIYISRFTGVSQVSDKYLPNLVIDGTTVYTLFEKGKVFSGVTIAVTYTYIPN